MVFRDTEGLIFRENAGCTPGANPRNSPGQDMGGTSLFASCAAPAKKDSGVSLKFTLFSGIKFGMGMFIGIFIMMVIMTLLSIAAVTSVLPESATTEITGMAVNLFGSM